MSVFRRLKSVGYLTSFTDAGRYYTLPDIPSFDSLGLWFYRGVGFSREGTLKSTVIHLVNSSERGMTPTDLLTLLRLRVSNSLHNTLHAVVKGNLVARHKVQGVHLYTSTHSDIAQQQMAAREKTIKQGLDVPAVVSVEETIAILVEAIKAGEVLPAPSTVRARLTAQGVGVTLDQVEHVFSLYALQAEKKTADQP
jgi:hypothetical protein